MKSTSEPGTTQAAIAMSDGGKLPPILEHVCNDDTCPLCKLVGPPKEVEFLGIDLAKDGVKDRCVLVVCGPSPLSRMERHSLMSTRIAATVLAAGHEVMFITSEIDHEGLKERAMKYMTEAVEQDRKLRIAPVDMAALAAECLKWEPEKETAYTRAKPSRPFYDHFINKGQRWNPPRRLGRKQTKWRK